MKKSVLLLSILTVVFASKVSESQACHAVALVNFTQQQYIPGVGLQVRAASNSPTCGCGAYWLDMEIRCINDVMDGSGLTAGVWSSVHCFPYYQSAQMMKPNCVVQDYPWLTVPDSDLCPGMTYQYRLRENHNGQVGPWTPIMGFTKPGVLDPNVGHLEITANPIQFCVNTQLGWNLIPGTGCGTSSCNNDTTYQWHVVSGEPIVVGVNFSCDTCPYPTAWPSIPTTYGLTIIIGDTNACGYGILTQTPVTVFPLPWPNAGTLSHQVDCVTGDINLDLSGHQGDVQWQTSVNGGSWSNIPGATNPTYFAGAVPPGTCYRVEVSTVCNTIYSNDICPTALPFPQANFSQTNVCFGEVMQFNDLTVGPGLVSWLWDFGDGNTSALPSPSHQYATAGQHNVSLTVTNSDGCSDMISMPVSVFEKPQSSFTVQDVCLGDESIFDNTSTIGAGNIVVWDWSFGDGNTSNQHSPTHTYSSENAYTVTLITRSDNGCLDTSVVVTYVHFQPEVDFSSTAICGDGSPTVFTNLSNHQSGAINWNWDFGDGNSSTAQDPSHTYTTPGEYTVTLIGSTTNGCSDTAVHSTTIYPMPVVDFSADETSACGNLCVNFTSNVTSTAGIASYFWNFGDGSTSSDINPAHCFTGANGSQNPVSFSVTLTVTTVNGCTELLTLQNYITINPEPIADFEPHPTVINSNSGHAYFHNWSTGGSTYAWDFDDGNTSNAYAPHHVYQDTGLFTVQLIVYNQFGCSDTAYADVYVVPNPALYVPTAFSPNADGVNDVFIPVFYSYENAEYTLQVFDRNGHVIFETNDMNMGWDGKVQGRNENPVPGVYVWKIVLRKPNASTIEDYIGHVTLIR